MKPLLFSACALLLMLTSPSSAQNLDYISHRLKDIRAKIAESPHSIIIVGDSLTEEAAWPDRLCGVPVINGGAGGSRTAFMTPLVTELLRSRPVAIVIATGMNDAHKTLWSDDSYDATFQSSYRAIVQAALNATPNVLLATISPVDYDALVGKVIAPHGRDVVNKDIRDIAAQYHLTAIDTDSLASAGPEPLLRDGVHFSSAGMQQFVLRIAGAVRNALGCL